MNTNRSNRSSWHQAHKTSLFYMAGRRILHLWHLFFMCISSCAYWRHRLYRRVYRCGLDWRSIASVFVQIGAGPTYDWDRYRSSLCPFWDRNHLVWIVEVTPETTSAITLVFACFGAGPTWFGSVGGTMMTIFHKDRRWRQCLIVSSVWLWGGCWTVTIVGVVACRRDYCLCCCLCTAVFVSLLVPLHTLDMGLTHIQHVLPDISTLVFRFRTS